MRSSILRIGSGYINHIDEVLFKSGLKGKILYVSGPIVGKLYGARIKYQLASIGQVEEEIVDNLLLGNKIVFSSSLVVFSGIGHCKFSS